MAALDAVHHAANHERKVLGEKIMNGHYVKALQELEKVKAHAQSLLERAEAQYGNSIVRRHRDVCTLIPTVNTALSN